MPGRIILAGVTGRQSDGCALENIAFFQRNGVAVERDAARTEVLLYAGRGLVAAVPQGDEHLG